MKKRLLVIITVFCLSLCAFVFAGCDLFPQDGGEVDATLYRLTLSSNMTLNDEQKAGLKATYGYGAPSATVVQGVRDEEEIAEYKKAGATDEDIAKAGVKQDDGSYYFFDQDPIYLEAPAIEGYKLLGFYDKDTDRFLINPILQDIDGGKYLPRYNMENKEVNIEARYEKWTYTVSFDNMEEGDTNPNTLTSYCFIDDGEVKLAPVTTTSEFKTFVRWEYQDTANSGNGPAEWVELIDGKLPGDYYEDYMRIHAYFEVDKFTISFAFEKYIDSSTRESGLTFDDVIDELLIKGNLATLNGTPVKCENSTDRTAVDKDDEIKIEYGSWLEIFPTLTDEYELWKYRINDGDEQMFYSEYGYILLAEDDVTKDSTITFILTEKIA